MLLHKFMIGLSCGLVVLITYSCDTTSSNKPADLIEEDVYINLLTEFQLLKSLSVIQGPAHVDSLEQVIFDRYDIAEERFLRSHHYYQEQMEEQIKRIEQVIENVKEEQGKSNKPKEDEDG